MEYYSSWFYRTKEELKGSEHKGLMNSYGAGGFAVDLTQSRDDYDFLMSELFDNLWIDRGTRAIFYDLTIYNANVNLFCQVR